MRAIVITPFTGMGEADAKPRGYRLKEEITGNLAFQAVEAKAAEWKEPPSAAEADALRSQVPSKHPIIVDAKPVKPEGGGQGQGGQGGGAPS